MVCTAPHDESIEVYSNCREVELFLNDKSVGRQTKHDDASPRVWRIEFAPGTLKAVGYDVLLVTNELRTAESPVKIVLSADRSQVAHEWDDVVCVTATVVDANGVVVPRASSLISFEISGPGVVAAVDSADNASHELFQAKERHAFQGRCVAYVKATAATGNIVLTASAPELKSASVTLTATAPK